MTTFFGILTAVMIVTAILIRSNQKKPTLILVKNKKQLRKRL